MGGIASEAIRRLVNPSSVAGTTIIVVAAIGVVINTATSLMFMSGRHGDLNIRGAFLHMAADALVSLGVVLAGIAILTTGWSWFDPVISLIIVIVVIVNTWQLFLDSLKLSLDAVPQTIEPQAVETFLTEFPGVARVHDLHIWAMSTTETALTAHLVMPEGYPSDPFLNQISQQLHEHFAIEHTTIQLETSYSNCSCTLVSENENPKLEDNSHH